VTPPAETHRGSGRATGEFAEPSRVEQLVLRGDGLTTTSLEILTGERVGVDVLGHWTVTVPAPGENSDLVSTLFEADSPDPGYYLGVAHQYLGASVGDRLLVRDVLLIGPTRTVHGSAELIARMDELPPRVADELAGTEKPIGRLLVEHGVQVRRELRSWGRMPAGARASRLGRGLSAMSRVPGRTYVMRLATTGTPLAVLTERFAPGMFEPYITPRPARRA
jgi:chorismate-pyruvate lyase